MKLQDALPLMTKLYLGRTVNSFLKDIRHDTEDELRDVINRNITEFQNQDRVKTNLNFIDTDRDIGVLDELILICLTETDGYVATGSQLENSLERLEERIVADSHDNEYISTTIPNSAGRIYSAVLAAAWEKDDSLNAHEKNILATLRDQLKLTRRHHRLLESRIHRFPRDANKLHSHKDINDALKDLQLRGLLVRFKTEDEYFVIPDEIARVVRYEIGGELKEAAYETLLNALTIEQLKRILSVYDLSSSGPKAVLVSRVIRFGVLPSVALREFNTDELSNLLRALDGPRISGSKAEKIESLIDYYENISRPAASDPMDYRSQYYDLFDELARRDYKALRESDSITKDLDIEHYFEEATNYLFEKRLEILPERFEGSKHADGRLKHGNKQVVLWDNKSTERPYNFPDEHVDQFLRYIRSDTMQPLVFLVVVFDCTPEAASQAQKLKYLSRADTDVALIRARDLKFVAENWRTYSDKKKPEFNLEVFNRTGVLDKDILKSRMNLVLGGS